MPWRDCLGWLPPDCSLRTLWKGMELKGCWRGWRWIWMMKIYINVRSITIKKTHILHPNVAVDNSASLVDECRPSRPLASPPHRPRWTCNRARLHWRRRWQWPWRWPMLTAATAATMAGVDNGSHNDSHDDDSRQRWPMLMAETSWRWPTLTTAIVVHSFLECGNYLSRSHNWSKCVKCN